MAFISRRKTSCVSDHKKWRDSLQARCCMPWKSAMLWPNCFLWHKDQRFRNCSIDLLQNVTRCCNPFNQHVRPCDHVAHGIVKGTLCQTNHLGTNPNATFVQQLDSNLVALAHLQGSSPNFPFTNDSDTLDQLQLTMVNTMKNDEWWS